MAKVSISEAARLAGISRQHLYKKWISPGLLTVEKDGEAPPLIDTSELLRVFGELKGKCLQPAEHCDHAELEMLRRLLSDREAQLREAREREIWMKQHIAEITCTFRVLEHKPNQAEQLQKARRVIQQYKQAFEATQNRGFWARLFNWEA